MFVACPDLSEIQVKLRLAGLRCLLVGRAACGKRLFVNFASVAHDTEQRVHCSLF